MSLSDTETAPKSAADRASSGARLPAQRSRVSNGTVLLPGIDGRSAEARRYRDLLDGFVLEFDIVDESDMRRAREAAHLSLWLELQASQTTRGESIAIELVTRTSNTVSRMLKHLAASKRARERAQRRRA